MGAGISADAASASSCSSSPSPSSSLSAYSVLSASCERAIHLVQTDCHSSIAYLSAHLQQAKIIPYHPAAQQCNWLRVHCNDHHYVIRVIAKPSHASSSASAPCFLLPVVPSDEPSDANSLALSLENFLHHLCAQLEGHTIKSTLADYSPRLIPPNPLPPSASAALKRDHHQQQQQQQQQATSLHAPSSPALPSSSLLPPSDSPVPSPLSPPFSPQPLSPSPASPSPSLSSSPAVMLINDTDGEAALPLFLSAFFDTCYTARPRRHSSIDTSASSLSSSSLSLSSCAAPVARKNLRCLHPNLLSLEEVVDGQHAYYVISKHYPRSLHSLLRCNRAAISSHATKLLLVYQLVHALAFLHERHVVHGDLKPDNLLLTGNMWLYVTGIHAPARLPHPHAAHSPNSTASSLPTIASSAPATPTSAIASPSLPSPLTSSAPSLYYTPHESALMRWTRGELSNLDYLLEVNRLAGRELHGVDVADYPIVPWVVDFSRADGGWRDLTKSKFRLKKGDHQLDFTYLHAASGLSSAPHHITELFSDITYYVYLARITPIDTLKRVVRDRFVAAEYPPSMARIYAWTPDEAIPEFYTSPHIFASMHRDLGLADLALPEWTSTPHQFVAWHRAMLESDHVSSRLHEWIDLTFGHALSGAAAVHAKNVPLKTAKQSSRRSAFVQLFHRPHPRRIFNHHRHPLPNAITQHNHQPIPAITNTTNTSPLHTSTSSDSFTPNASSSSAPSGIASLSSSASASAAILPSVTSLSLFESAAAFDADFCALSGCYTPLYAPPASHSTDSDSDDSESIDSDQLSGSALHTLKLLQAGDMFSVGCIIAECYLNAPLFSPLTHSLYAQHRFTPDLTALPLPVRSLVQQLIHANPHKRPSARQLLHHAVFHTSLEQGAHRRLQTYDPSYQCVYEFIAELRRQQALFPLPPPNTQFTMPLTSSSSASAASASSSLLLPAYYIPSDDIHTPPNRPSPLADMYSVMSPPEFLGSVNERERERERVIEREREEEARWSREEEDDDELQKNGDSHPNNERGGGGGAALTSANGSSVSHSVGGNDVASRQLHTLDWCLDQLPQLSTLPLDVYVLLVPHVLSLCSQPDVQLASLDLFDPLARKLRRSLSGKLLVPVLHELLLKVDDSDLQCELVTIHMLRMVRQRFGYLDFFRTYLAHVRNSLLSSDWRVAQACTRTLHTFLTVDVDLTADVQQELALRDVLLPMLARLGRSGSAAILDWLIALLPELDPSFIIAVMLPTSLQLIEKGAAPTDGFTKLELDTRLACGLDLLYAVLPDLTPTHYSALISEQSLLKSLLNGSQRGPLTSQCTRRLIKVLVLIMHELVHQEHKHHDKDNKEKDRAVAGVGGAGSASEKMGLKSVRSILPLLPVFSDFLQSMLHKLEHTHTEARSSHEFITTLYCSLSVLLGLPMLRKAVTNTAKIEAIIQLPPVSSRRASITGTPSSSSAASSSPSLAVDLSVSVEVEKARLHAASIRARRVHYPSRAQSREADRYAMKQLESSELDEDRRYRRREQDHNDEHRANNDTDTSGGGAAAGTGDDKDKDKKAGSKERERDDDSTDDDDDEEEDGNEPSSTTATTTSSSSAKPTLLNRDKSSSAFSSSSTSLLADKGKSKRANFFSSWLSSSTSSADASTAHLTLDVSDLCSIDASWLNGPASASSPHFQFKPSIAHTTRCHSASVLAISAHQHQGLFITSSRDEKVKLWSLSMATGALHHTFTYTQHTQPVFDCKLLLTHDDASARLVASCDLGMHVWDLETGTTVLQSPLYALNGRRVLQQATPPITKHDKDHTTEPILCFDYVPERHALVLGTAAATLRWLDLSTGIVSGAWRHLGSQQAVSPVRCCTVHGDTIATGLTSGEITLFDQRTGLIRHQWRAHESQVIKLVSCSHTHLLSTAADKTIVVWHIAPHAHSNANAASSASALASAAAGVRCVQRFSSLDDSIRCLLVHHDDFLCALGNRIAIGSLVMQAHNEAHSSPFATPSHASLSGHAPPSMHPAPSPTPTLASSALPSSAANGAGGGVQDARDGGAGASSVGSAADWSDSHKRVNSKLSVTPLKGHKSRSAITAMALLPNYNRLLLATDDGKLLITS